MSNDNFDESLFAVPYTEFKSHLSIPDNDRILFSGRFGVGKTSFLRWFFDKADIKQEYKVVRLYPVNYSVASNEDIFKYIKMDILAELLRDGEVTLDHFEFSAESILALSLSQSKFDLFVTSMLTLIEGKGEANHDLNILKPLIEGLGKLIEKYKEVKDKHKKEASYLSKVKEFVAGIEQKEGSAYEFNFISEIISNLIDQLREKNKKVVLAIDDLDRVDPHHIFRIFNVFGAHFDGRVVGQEKNKFGFDKIVLVGDISNLRNIFHHFYGSNVDFSGYIDKFYSNSIFYFNNNNAILQIVRKKIDQYNFSFKKQDKDISPNQVINDDFRSDLSQFIAAFVVIGKLNLRNLKKENLSINERLIAYKDSYTTFQFPFVMKVLFLVGIVGDVHSLKILLKAAHQQLGKSYRFSYYDDLLKEVLPIFYIDSDKKFSEEKILELENLDIRYLITSQGRHTYQASSLSINGKTDNYHILTLGPSLFFIYLHAIEFLENLGYWK